MTEAIRRETARDKVLAALRESPKTSRELNTICFRYGARIHELRARGHFIRAELTEPGVFLYTLESQLSLS